MRSIGTNSKLEVDLGDNSMNEEPPMEREDSRITISRVIVIMFAYLLLMVFSTSINSGNDATPDVRAWLQYVGSARFQYKLGYFSDIKPPATNEEFTLREKAFAQWLNRLKGRICQKISSSIVETPNPKYMKIKPEFVESRYMSCTMFPERIFMVAGVPASTDTVALIDAHYEQSELWDYLAWSFRKKFISDNLRYEDLTRENVLDAAREVVAYLSEYYPIIFVRNAGEVWKYSNLLYSDSLWSTIRTDTELQLMLSSPWIYELSVDSLFQVYCSEPTLSSNTYDSIRNLISSPTLSITDKGTYIAKFDTWSPEGGVIQRWNVVIDAKNKTASAEDSLVAIGKGYTFEFF